MRSWSIRFFVVVIIFSLLAATAPGTFASTGTESAIAEAADLSKAYEAVRASVVQLTVVKEVELEDGSGITKIEVVSGSGFGYSPGSYIVTNSHVVDKALAVLAYNHTGTASYWIYPRSIWTDPVSDMAVLQINGIIQPVKFADPAGIKVGQSVFAIGAPYGTRYRSSLTRGVLSGLGRDLGKDYTYMQTDTPLNPGNSGGPLFNAAGEIVGVNTYKMRGADGVGFALPATVAKEIVDALIRDKQITRPWFGLSFVDGNAADLGFPGITDGPMVESVDAEGPAKDAGIQPGATLARINMEPVSTLPQISAFLRKAKPGDKVKLHFNTEKGTTIVDVTLGTRPADGELFSDSYGLWLNMNTTQVWRAMYVGKRMKAYGFDDRALTDSWTAYAGEAKAILVSDYLLAALQAWETVPMNLAAIEKRIKEREGHVEVRVDLPAKWTVSDPQATWSDRNGTTKATLAEKTGGAPKGMQRWVVRLTGEHLAKTGSAELVLRLDAFISKRFVFQLDDLH